MIWKALVIFCMTVSVISAYTTCLSCKHIVHARDCSTIERCGPYSACYIDGYVTSLGYVRYNLGCRDNMQCISDNTTPSGGQVEDFEFCTKCCSGDLCNSKGCRDTGYPSVLLRGPICFNCPDQQLTNDCQVITVCPLGDVCKLKRILYGVNSELRYESKCENRQKCNAEVEFYKKPWALVGRKRDLNEFQIGNTCMIQCCDTDICNVGCNSTSLTPLSTTSTLPSTSIMPSPVKKPIIDILPFSQQHVFFQLGSSINLTCESMSLPVPTITWTFKKTAASNVVINSNTLTFTSLQPSQIGNYTCTAHNVYGSTSKTIFILSNVTGALDCDFETMATCMWTTNPMTGGQWSNSGVPNVKTAAVNLDPILRNQTGSFLYASLGATQSTGVMDLVSPELGPSGPACLSFLYFCHGDSGHQIHVEIVTNCDFTACNNSTPRTVIIAGSSGPPVGWSLAQMPLTATAHDHNLIIRSTHVQGTRQDYCAIDDVKYYDGDCKPSIRLSGHQDVSINASAGGKLRLTCQIHGFPTPVYHWSKLGGCGQFETSKGSTVLVSDLATNGDAGTYTCTANNGGPYVTSLSQTFHVNVKGETDTLCTFEHGLCGWTQSGHDDFEWTRTSNSTPSVDTGPTVDHTMGNSSGFYMYIETSSPRHLEEGAVLRSPRFAANHSACVSFFYHMAGSDIGQLTLSSQDSCTGERDVLFHAHGSQGSKWLFNAVSIPAMSVRHDYHVDILATVGASYHGDIAVDDIRVSHDVCS